MGYFTCSEGRKESVRRLLLVGMLIALFLAACGGRSNGDNEPASVVKNAVEAWERLDEEDGKYICKKYGSLVKDILPGISEYTGLSVDDVKQIIKYRFTDMKYEERYRENDKAIVHVTGLAKVELDGAKFKELAIRTIEARGETISDEDLELLDLIVPLITELNTETEVNGDVELIREEGEWKVCDDFDIFGFP